MDGAEIQSYVAKTRGANTHSSKASLFSKLVESLFGGEVDVALAPDVFPELEEHLIAEKGTLAVKKKEDTPEPNLIIEFRTTKLDPLRSGEIIERAKDQLRRFAYAIWRERQPELRCLLTASDGVHNFVYRPSLKGDLDSVDLEGVSPFTIDKKLREIIDLEEISRQDFSRGDPERVCKWLERIIFGRLSDG
ncbi:hypothetical protein AKJ39_04495 [candidate division MSBL1 archaeon SCGC-AAA259J03]|uniref:Uncharacterized protein n=1 Tax=candidate division MSBL1 archaeon SCGC-AAA259J03 TaxID=1698269 RepID=A0A656YUZ7_9EURY|nr:hypothetical protein AKJ39_04495 [candidate division MSBL1 archaeon SCGC-AAA259J03]